MNPSSASSKNGNSKVVTNPSTDVTSSTALGTDRKSIDDPSSPPPLPSPIKRTQTSSQEFISLSTAQVDGLNELAISAAQTLTTGCYSISFFPGAKYYFDGTLRVHTENGYTEASGDLYHRDVERKHDDKIPVFAIRNYRYYLRVTKISEFVPFLKAVNLGFEMWRYNGASATPMWTKEGFFKAEMIWSPVSDSKHDSFLKGVVKNSSDEVLGEITMRKVSEHVRNVTLEIDTVEKVEPPFHESNLKDDWQKVFDQVNWEIKVKESNKSIKPPSGTSWSDGELHAEMLKHRMKSDLDKVWRYHMLVVGLIDTAERGIMYDTLGTDSDNVAREGVGIAYNWIFPDQEPWKDVANERFGKIKRAYFRTAVHEVCHAMGLTHNVADNGIMNTTDNIARSSTKDAPFPGNIPLEFHPDDRKRLRHMPDIFVRPGGVPFGAAYSVDPMSIGEELEKATGVELIVSPVEDEHVIPIGAPVRLNLKLNRTAEAGDKTIKVPGSLNMKVGFVKGKVIDPTGNVRSFSPIIVCVDEVPLLTVGPDGISDSLTLLRGVEGALFSVSGPYNIQIEVTWESDQRQLGLTSSTNVYIMPPKDEAHAKAALDILSTPDTLLSLVLSGDHNTEGNSAINDAFKNDVLKPHYSYLELKNRMLSKKTSLKVEEIIEGINGKTAIMTPSEVEKAIRFLVNINPNFASASNTERQPQSTLDQKSGRPADMPQQNARLKQESDDITTTDISEAPDEDFDKEKVDELLKIVSEESNKDQGAIQPPAKVLSPGSKDLDDLINLINDLRAKRKEPPGNPPTGGDNGGNGKEKQNSQTKPYTGENKELTSQQTLVSQSNEETVAAAHNSLSGNYTEKK